jgi:hypothetical protein
VEHWHDFRWFEDRPLWQKVTMFVLIVAVLLMVRAAVG